jgi:hypothetical protein
MAELVEFARRRLEPDALGLASVTSTGILVGKANAGAEAGAEAGAGAEAEASIIGIFTGDFYCDMNVTYNMCSNFFYVYGLAIPHKAA